MGGEVTGCLEPARGWESVLGERELKLQVLGEVSAAGSQARFPLQCDKVAGKSYHFKASHLHPGHFDGSEGKEN